MNTIISELIEIQREYKKKSEFAISQHIKVWKGEKPSKQPLLLQSVLSSVQTDRYPLYDSEEIHFDSQKMLINGLREALTIVNGGYGAVPSVRANMGCGIFPSLLGVKPLLFKDKMPWVKEHMSKDKLKRMSPEDICISDEFKTGLEHMAYIAMHLKNTGCMVYPMDLQGAYDTAHIVYGDQIFYDMYDDPKFVHHLLELSSAAIIFGMGECMKVMPDSNKMIAHYNSLVIPRDKGGIKISEDTSTLLSKHHIEEFVIPYMRKVLKHFGGGYIHYCGKNQHLFDAVMNEPLAYGLNFGEPDKHDMVEVLRQCAKRGMIYYGPIAKSDKISYEEYFTKYLSAALIDLKIHLLLQLSCRNDDREEIIEAWEKSTENLLSDAANHADQETNQYHSADY